MIVICEECGKKYQINPEKIKGESATFECKSCGQLITARKPSPSKTVQEAQDIPDAHANGPDFETFQESDPPREPRIDKSKKKKKSTLFSHPRKIRFGLTAKLFTMMIIISLVPLTMFWGITLKQAKKRIRYEAQKDTGRQFVSTMQNMDAWFYEKVRLLESLAETDDIVSMDSFRQMHLLNAFHTLFPEISSLFIIDLNGSNKIIASRNSERQYLEKKYFKEIMSGKALAWQTGISPKTKKPDLILAVSIKTQNQLSGILVTVFSLENITKQFSVMEPGHPGFALLVKNKGKIFIDKNDNYVKGLKKVQWQPLIARFRSGQNGLTSFTDLTGNPIFGYVEKTAFGWGIALQSEEKRSVLMIKQLMSFAYLLLAITVVFVFIIAWFSGRALARPIIKLTDTADRISVGALDLEIRTNRKDELGELAEAIARMQDSIRLSIERLRRRH